MSAPRIWNIGDPEPGDENDRPAVVDRHGFTHSWSESDDGDGSPGWNRQVITHRGEYSTSGPLGEMWEDVLAEGAPVREAVGVEARTWIEITAPDKDVPPAGPEVIP